LDDKEISLREAIQEEKEKNRRNLSNNPTNHMFEGNNTNSKKCVIASDLEHVTNRRSRRQQAKKIDFT